MLFIHTFSALSLGCVLLISCSTRDVGPLPHIEQTCEFLGRTHNHKGSAVADVLLVVDRSPAMAPYAEALEDGLRMMGEQMDSIWPDLHVAVVAADGQGFQSEPQLNCDTPPVPYLIAEREPWFRCGSGRPMNCPIRNFDTELGEAIACMASLAPKPGADRQVLRAAVKALDTAPTDYRRWRSDALLIVIISAGDDQSPGGTEEYAELLSLHAGEYSEVILTIVAPPEATRLRTLNETVEPYFGPLLSIDGEWPQRIEAILSHLSLDILPYSCLRHSEDSGRAGASSEDVDLGNPGIQPNCVATPMFESNRAGLPMDAIIPPCQMETSTLPHRETITPCWWLEPDLDQDCELYPHTEGISNVLWACDSDC